MIQRFKKFLKKFIKRSHVVDPVELKTQALEINEKLEREAPHRNRLASYLIQRKDQNGFGSEFEYTLRPRET